MTRFARAFAVAIIVDLLLLWAALTCIGGCAVEILDAHDPDADCEPGDLLCPCVADSDCADHGLGGERGTCGPQDRCTIACVSDSDCAEREHATCGPTDVAGVLVCTEVSP
jgi:hypothetical protein